MFANTIKLLWLARFAKDRIISGPIPAGSPEVTTKGIILSLSIKNVNELIDDQRRFLIFFQKRGIQSMIKDMPRLSVCLCVSCSSPVMFSCSSPVWFLVLISCSSPLMFLVLISCSSPVWFLWRLSGGSLAAGRI